MSQIPDGKHARMVERGGRGDCYATLHTPHQHQRRPVILSLLSFAMCEFNHRPLPFLAAAEVSLPSPFASWAAARAACYQRPSSSDH